VTYFTRALSLPLSDPAKGAGTKLRDPTEATFQTFAFGANASCTNTGYGRGRLGQIAAATGGTCTRVTDIATLPDVVPGVIDSQLTKLDGRRRRAQRALLLRASALNLLGLLEPVAANRPNDPCRDHSAGLVSALLNVTGLVGGGQRANATSDQAPNTLAASTPAIGERPPPTPTRGRRASRSASAPPPLRLTRRPRARAPEPRRCRRRARSPASGSTVRTTTSSPAR
jgi:hypothetical protein